MALEVDGRTRADLVREELEAWLAESPSDALYLAFSADYSSEATLLAPDPVDRQTLLALVETLEPWAAVDLLGASTDVVRQRPDVSRLLVATDGEDPYVLIGEGAPPPRGEVEVLLLVPPELSQSAASRLSLHVMTRMEPVSSARPVSAPLQAAVHVQAGPGNEAERTTSDASQDSLTAHPSLIEHGLVQRWARIARFPFLVATMAGVAAWIQALLRQQQRKTKVDSYNAAPPSVVLDVRSPDGRQTMEIRSYPTTADGGLTFEARGTDIWAVARANARFNGSRREEHQISQGDIIRSDATRITVSAVEKKRRLRPPRNDARLYWLAPLIAMIASVAAFVMPRVSVSPAGDPNTTVQEELRVDQSDHVSEATGDARQLSPAAIVNAPSRPLPTVVRYPDITRIGDVDFLLIHAHPDDESIDFGALVARLTAGGARGAALILTDGQSGRDQYPYRVANDLYPPYDMASSQLAGRRIEETRQALSWLGVESYVRFGLENYPYNSIEQELTPQEVVTRWNDQLRLLSALIDLIEQTRPEVILSPDRQGFAREHFEHDATGTLVAQAIEDVNQGGTHIVALHIRSIDPFQTEGYTDLERVNAWLPAADGTIPRLMQSRALLAHRTQRDASAIAVENRLALDEEFYRVDSFDPQDDGSARIYDGIDELIDTFAADPWE